MSEKTMKKLNKHWFSTRVIDHRRLGFWHMHACWHYILPSLHHHVPLVPPTLKYGYNENDNNSTSIV